MEYDQITSARLSVVEARMASLEQRLATLEQGSTAAKPRRRKELTPEQRQQIRARLVAGQEAARARREAEAKKSNKKKEAKDGTSKATD
jgi:hypothetical protein